jgi:hypothetical protein
MSLDTCLSLLSMVTDVCSSHLQPTSLPSLCVSALGLVMDLRGEYSAAPPPAMNAGYVQQPTPWGVPAPEPRAVGVLPPPLPECPVYSPAYSTPQQASPYMPCTIAVSPTPAPAMKERIVASADGDQLEMCVGDACMACKKMTVKLGDCMLTVTPFHDKVRIRGDELRATAAGVRMDGKDRLILEGGAVLRHTKAGQQTKIIKAERIELNLRTGKMTVESAGTMERVGVNYYP